ncbi:MDR family MFS transporter [Cryobacterium sp. PH29-G1]|uniref:MDR family MFS transporter n=1 Tax=Cryobacterium sp. PH29-G1 TaxID=3046211 RepID=UPI0024BBCCFC|nr:MDR family MFS transporter [Cryobacterium sp. PH29-G1]MDJ0350150.1 MDR family MFS transporter [Cryobacterium sp. PH29-G1]
MSRASRTVREPVAQGSMTHRQVLEALSGLLLGMFVSILANTVVSTSLPLILSDLKGSQSAYTWVVTATLLATTVSTPIWGKFADLFNRKLLIQLALAVFVIGSALAGLSQDAGMLIAFRVLQGLGAGGLVALSQIIMADIISPRERGRYAGLFGAVMALGTIGGPLLGGVVTDAFGWRWNFFIALPVAIVAIILLQRTLHLPPRVKRVVRIDYLGAALITSGISLLLIWVTLAGSQFEWQSLTSFAMVIGAVVLLVAAVIVEFRAPEPIIPLGLFRNRTFSFATIASLAVGVSLFGTSVFLSQYMQLARGATPTQSGLLTIPMMGGLLISSTLFGTVISRRGTWKSIMVSGSVLMLVGTSLLGTLDVHTSLVFVGAYMFVLGAGLGMVMQNLVLVVQNTIEVRHLGVATSSVTFFRSLGGAVGVSVMGSILGTVVATQITSSVGRLSPTHQADAARLLGDGVIPQVNLLPGVIRIVVETAYGSGVGTIFLISAPLALVTLLMVSLLPNHPLGTENGIDRAREATVKSESAPESAQRREVEDVEDILIDVSAASAGLRPVGLAHETQSIRIITPSGDETSSTPTARDE